MVKFLYSFVQQAIVHIVHPTKKKQTRMENKLQFNQKTVKGQIWIIQFLLDLYLDQFLESAQKG